MVARKPVTMDISIDFRLGADWDSRLIAWYGNGYKGYSHAAPLLSTGEAYVDARNDWVRNTDGTLVPPGVQRRPVAAEKAIRVTRASLAVPVATAAKWDRQLTGGIGNKYDQWDILGFITGHPLTEGKGYWICSEWSLVRLQALDLMSQTLPFPTRQCTPNSLLWMLGGREAPWRIRDLDPVTLAELPPTADATLH